MVDEIKRESGISSDLAEGYLPKLKLDILFGIHIMNSTQMQYILLEVKYLTQLSLAEYSQMMGYLQVAKRIKIGILFLVIKPESQIPLSNDFKEILQTHNLPMSWKMVIDMYGNGNYDFKTGISVFVPKNGIEWIDTSVINGIFSFEDLAKELVK